jgi:hypothetical protein
MFLSHVKGVPVNVWVAILAALSLLVSPRGLTAPADVPAACCTNCSGQCCVKSSDLPVSPAPAVPASPAPAPWLKLAPPPASVGLPLTSPAPLALCAVPAGPLTSPSLPLYLRHVLLLI